MIYVVNEDTDKTQFLVSFSKYLLKIYAVVQTNMVT